MFRHRFAILLVALILQLMLTAVVGTGFLGLSPNLSLIIIRIFFAVTLLAAVLADGASRGKMIFAAALAAPAVLLQVLSLFFEEDWIEISRHIFTMLFLVYTIVTIFRSFFLSERVVFDTICASLCVYLLMGLLWAIAYSLIDLASPGSFEFAYANDQGAGTIQFGNRQSVIAIYFSFVTMTTLGYGDIVPLSTPARMFAVMQAVFGQLYLAVLVARLVGLHIVHAARDGDSSGGT